MSGGSFNYLSGKAQQPAELVEAEADLQRMYETLKALPCAGAARMDTLSILLAVKRLRQVCDEVAPRLVVVWHDIEWWKSRDISENDAVASVARYEHASAARREEVGQS